jgi:hypothetical protein
MGQDASTDASVPLNHSALDISRYLQSALAIFICAGVLHSGSNSAGEQTRIDRHFAREVATFNRFNE